MIDQWSARNSRIAHMWSWTLIWPNDHKWMKYGISGRSGRWLCWPRFHSEIFHWCNSGIHRNTCPESGAVGLRLQMMLESSGSCMHSHCLRLLKCSFQRRFYRSRIHLPWNWSYMSWVTFRYKSRSPYLTSTARNWSSWWFLSVPCSIEDIRRERES